VNQLLLARHGTKKRRINPTNYIVFFKKTGECSNNTGLYVNTVLCPEPAHSISNEAHTRACMAGTCSPRLKFPRRSSLRLTNLEAKQAVPRFPGPRVRSAQCAPATSARPRPKTGQTVVTGNLCIKPPRVAPQITHPPAPSPLSLLLLPPRLAPPRCRRLPARPRPEITRARRHAKMVSSDKPP
jgi:hypothetical protein